jgi:hypothetical protein
MNEKPIIQRKDGNLNFSVFAKTSQDGKTYYSISFQRSYKKKGTEEWNRETVNMFPDDLLKLSSLASVTYTDIVAHTRKSKATPTYTAPEFNDDIPF